MSQWVIARTARKRPTLMHLVADGGKTACGSDLTGWSRAYFDAPIPQVTCIRCKAMQ